MTALKSHLILKNKENMVPGRGLELDRFLYETQRVTNTCLKITR